MKPENLPGQITPEISASFRQGVENAFSIENQEVKGSNSESEGKSAEINSIVSEINTVTAIPAPIVDDSVVVTDTTNLADIATSDDGVIEREWVDRAKKIINETKSNPYKQEEEVKQLQNDYLREKFGRGLDAKSEASK
jgi:hypothetical protein